MLYRIAYFSRNRIRGTQEVIQSEVQQILQTSQRNNSLVDVTGALIFNSGGFAQILEGEQERIATVFERIQNDVRHSDVLVLEYERVSSRLFPGWSMGFLGQSKSDEHLFGAVSAQSGFRQDAFNATDLLEAMKRIVMEEEFVP